jgi:hypothetical protein
MACSLSAEKVPIFFEIKPVVAVSHFCNWNEKKYTPLAIDTIVIKINIFDTRIPP